MPYMEFLRFPSREQAVIDTYMETVIPTPCSGNENLAMLIHQIKIRVDHPQFVAGVEVYVNASVHDRQRSSVSGEMNVGCLMRYMRYIWVDAGGQYQWQAGELDAITQYFDPPILYAKQNIYFGLNSGNCISVRGGYAAIGYTLEKVAKDDFIAALVV